MRKHIAEWHRSQGGIAPGYKQARILADCDRPGVYLLQVSFTSKEEAKKNNERAETNVLEDWALVKSEPSYRNLTDVSCTKEA